MWSHDVIATSINLAADLKMGQYLKIPPRAMFITQVWGTLLGMYFILPALAPITDPFILRIPGAFVNYGMYIK